MLQHHTGAVPTPFPQTQESYQELPPLILHPIAGIGEVLHETSDGDDESRLMEVRRLELKMLCCLGKDLNRWLEQCLEFATRNPNLAGLRERHLIDLLVEHPPENVNRKMLDWGVIDFRAIFARALGLAVVFPEPPASERISEIFARDTAIYAEALYRVRRQSLPSGGGPLKCRFEIYASGEYARLLEQGWEL